MPSFKTKVKIKFDDKGLKDIGKKLHKQKDMVVDVGHFDGKIHDEEAKRTIADTSLANQQGFTTGNGKEVPARPYMQIALESPAFMKEYEKVVMAIAKGNTTIAKELPKLGRLLRDIMMGVIQTSFNIAPNSPVTIALKGSDTPLIHTATLVNDIESRLSRDVGRRRDRGINKVAR